MRYTAADEGEYNVPTDLMQLAGLFPPPSEADAPIIQAMVDRMGATSAEGVAGYGAGGDRRALTLHADDEASIQAVAAANPRTVVAIMAGSAVITEAWLEQVPAILMLWYSGMEGGHAFADVLLGRVNPSGRLPCTFPRRLEDLPFFDRDATAITYDLWHGYRKLERDGAQPAFPFSFGLSYTTYAYRNPQLSRDRLGADGTLEARIDVTNTGDVAGEEVVQLYIAALGSQVERAPPGAEGVRSRRAGTWRDAHGQPVGPRLRSSLL